MVEMFFSEEYNRKFLLDFTLFSHYMTNKKKIDKLRKNIKITCKNFQTPTSPPSTLSVFPLSLHLLSNKTL